VKKILVLLGAALLAIGLSVTAASAKSTKAAADAEACVLLPDSKSSVRWETQDRRFLANAFKAGGVSYNIVNAEGVAATQSSQADQCITNGAKVILLVNLDSGSGAAIQSRAKAAGVKVIDYDRLTLKGSAEYYVSFNNVTVGKLQGQGIVSALKAKNLIGAGKGTVVALLNGSPTDNNATLFKQGYVSVLNPYFKARTLIKGPDQSVPQWDNQKARTIFEQMLVKTNNNIDAVAAANDGLGNAVITALKAKKLSPIPVSGQDATSQGVQNTISGWQSGTVYKSIQAEANAAAALAIQLIKNQPITGVNGKVNDGVRNVPSVLLKPIWITKSNYNILFTQGFLKRSDVCVGAYKQYCN
jgi:D-xylose transport system substrate-binding protein